MSGSHRKMRSIFHAIADYNISPPQVVNFSCAEMAGAAGCHATVSADCSDAAKYSLELLPKQFSDFFLVHIVPQTVAAQSRPVAQHNAHIMNIDRTVSIEVELAVSQNSGNPGIP